MIQACVIRDKIKADVDAEGSDYYTDLQDYIPAINKSIDWCVGVINMAFASKKISEEAFADLMRTRIYQANTFSRIMLPGPTQTDDIWTVLAILPLPTTYPNNSITVTANPVESFFRNDLSLQSSKYTAERLTVEEWETNLNNPFESGHVLVTGEQPSEFGYLAYNDYTGTNYTLTPRVTEIEVRPSIASQLCAVRYVKRPAPVVAITDFIEFPFNMENIIYLRALQYLSYKQGDNTTIYQDSQNDLKLLLSAFL